jgi:hypothetical protein
MGEAAMNALTQREIDRGIAFRKRPDGEIVSYEVCNACQHMFLRADHKLGYGTGRALCRDCTAIGPAISVPLSKKVFALLDVNVGKGSGTLATKIGARREEVHDALKQMELDGKVKCKNALWFALES